jgi:raffinose/stachyose/melibiose transport system permease protein
MKRVKARISLRSWVLFILVIIIAALYSLPMYSALVNAFKTYNDMTLSPLKPPTSLYLGNFTEVFKRTDFLRVYMNSFFITGVSVIILVFLSASAAYPFARFQTRLNSFVYVFFMMGLMVPSGLSLISLIKILLRFRINGTYLGLFLSYAGSAWIPFLMFIYIGFIRTIPRSLEESAYIDGAGYFRSYWQIVFPLLKPCTGSVIIFSGMGIWNDFLTPLLVLGGGEGSKTVTVAIYSFAGKYITRFNLIFAVMVLAVAPILILFLFLQKEFIKGLTAGAIKA